MTMVESKNTLTEQRVAKCTVEAETENRSNKRNSKLTEMPYKVMLLTEQL